MKACPVDRLLCHGDRSRRARKFPARDRFGFHASRAGMNLVVLGKYDGACLSAPGCRSREDEVKVWQHHWADKRSSGTALSQHAYVHGHQVGGTNPHWSKRWWQMLRFAHDNKFNRWVAGEGGILRRCRRMCGGVSIRLWAMSRGLVWMREASRLRHRGESYREDSASTNRCCWLSVAVSRRRLQRPELRFTAVVLFKFRQLNAALDIVCTRRCKILPYKPFLRFRKAHHCEQIAVRGGSADAQVGTLADRRGASGCGEAISSVARLALPLPA